MTDTITSSLDPEALIDGTPPPAVADLARALHVERERARLLEVELEELRDLFARSSGGAKTYLDVIRALLADRSRIDELERQVAAAQVR